jgi:hypothetical protein
VTARARACASIVAGEIELRFPYSERVIARLKQEIPPEHRRWDPGAKVWRVTEPYAKTAMDVLIARFPTAETPDSGTRRAVAVASENLSTGSDLPLPAQQLPLRSEPCDLTLLATIPCPHCHARHEQPIRLIVETSAVAAKRALTPELVSVCPSCNTLAVVSVSPVAADAVLFS